MAKGLIGAPRGAKTEGRGCLAPPLVEDKEAAPQKAAPSAAVAPPPAGEVTEEEARLAAIDDGTSGLTPKVDSKVTGTSEAGEPHLQEAQAGDGTSTLRATARPFVPSERVRRRCRTPAATARPCLDEGRHGAGRRVHWPGELVSDAWTIPQVPSSEKARLFYTRAEFKRWRRELEQEGGSVFAPAEEFVAAITDQ